MTIRLAVVTGANRGIGAAIAGQLVAAGLRVVGTGRDEARDRGTIEALGAEYAMLDVTIPASRDALAAGLEGGLDVLVNNAGVALDGFDADVARRTIDVNVYGPMHLTDRLLPSIRAGGRIVMVSSTMGMLSAVSSALRERFEDPALRRTDLVALLESFVSDVAAGVHAERGWPSSAYRVSKIGLNALTRIVARELAGDPRRILVNAACPGWVRTRMGGRGAPRTPEQGAKTPVMLALLPEGGPSGGFFQDERPIDW